MISTTRFKFNNVQCDSGAAMCTICGGAVVATRRAEVQLSGVDFVANRIPCATMYAIIVPQAAVGDLNDSVSLPCPRPCVWAAGGALFQDSGATFLSKVLLTNNLVDGIGAGG